MAKNLLQELLLGQWRDPDVRENVTLPVQEIVIENNITARAPEYLEKYQARRFLLVADETTYEVQGRAIEENIKRKGWEISSLILKNGIEAAMENIAGIKTRAAAAEIIIGVGSGTISDLCKYSAFLLKIPYVVFATAPSMNGYASANASLKIGKYKKSLPAQMPAGIYFDLDILAKAPERLIKSGIGDLLCRPSAEADWRLSHLLLGTPFKTAPFALLKENEKQLYESAAEMLKGDMAAMRILAEGLILSGIGMYICGGSQPASQGEHLIAHYMEMLHPELPKTFHGEQIGVTTLTMLDIQAQLLGNEISAGDYKASEEKIIRTLGMEIGVQAARAVGNKAEAYKNSGAREKINREWKTVAAEITPILARKEKIYDILKTIGAPTTPADLGWSSHYPGAVSHAFMLRDRFTFLDIAHVARL